jgi:hypothetical protein
LESQIQSNKELSKSSRKFGQKIHPLQQTNKLELTNLPTTPSSFHKGQQMDFSSRQGGKPGRISNLKVLEVREVEKAK